MVISKDKPTSVLAVGIGPGVVTTLLSTVVEVPLEMENISARHRYTNKNLALCRVMLNNLTFNFTSTHVNLSDSVQLLHSTCN